MTDLTLENATVVVLSDGNNPMILNPDFLERNGIVQSDWNAAEVIVTPPLSFVRYEKGLTVQMEENKISFVAHQPAGFAWEEVLPKVAIRFLEVLPHVSYKAVGLNFQLHSEVIIGQPAEDKLIKHLLATGEWLNFSGGLTGSVVEFQFRKSFPYLNVKVGVKETISEIGKQLGGPSMVANFHHDFAPQDVAARSAFMRKVAEYEKQLHQFARLLPVFQA